MQVSVYEEENAFTDLHVNFLLTIVVLLLLVISIFSLLSGPVSIWPLQTVISSI